MMMNWKRRIIFQDLQEDIENVSMHRVKLNRLAKQAVSIIRKLSKLTFYFGKTKI